MRSVAKFVAFGLVAILFTAEYAQAGIVVGNNSVYSTRKGKLYIPQTAATSGEFGQSLGVKKAVGFQGDKIRLDGIGTTSGGSMTFQLNFSFADLVDADNATIKLTLRDLDFMPQNIRGAWLTEKLTLQFVPDAGGAPAGTPVVLDQTNYGLFRADGFGPTNGKTVAYEIDLKNDFGLVLADIIDLNTDKEFSILFTLTADVERFKKGAGTYRKSLDSIDAKFDYLPGSNVPEPATMSLILLGLPLLARRRSRRDQLT